MKLTTIILGTAGGKGEFAPRSIKVFVNRPNGISFEDAESIRADQEFNLMENDDGKSIRYPMIKLNKFNNVREITLHFVSCYFLFSSRYARLIFSGSCAVEHPVDGSVADTLRWFHGEGKSIAQGGTPLCSFHPHNSGAAI